MSDHLSLFSRVIPESGSWDPFFSILLWGTVFLVLVTAIGIWARNKIKYQYRAEVFKRRQEDFDSGIPDSKTVEGKAGYFIVRGKTIFRIKYGPMPWQQIQLSKIPDPKYMIDNKVYYLQLQKDNYVQAKMSIDWKGEFSLKPVEDDLKYGAQLDIMEKDKILNTKTTWEKFGGPVIMGFIFIAGIMAMYFVQKSCNG